MHRHSDYKGLPVDLGTVADVEEKTDAVYAHVYRVYPVVPSPFYGAAVCVNSFETTWRKKLGSTRDVDGEAALQSESSPWTTQ